MSVRIIVADDHAIVREGLCRLLSSEEGVDIVAQAGDGREVLRTIERCTPDIVLMDIGMPEVNGIEATRELKRVHPQVRVLILTAYEDDNLIRMARRAGADGYVLKSADRGLLLHAIGQVLSTGEHFPEELQADADASMNGSGVEELTRREREIFKLVVKGLKNKEISEELCISVKTVEKHRANLMKKLGLHSVAELVSYALKTGFMLEE